MHNTCLTCPLVDCHETRTIHAITWEALKSYFVDVPRQAIAVLTKNPSLLNGCSRNTLSTGSFKPSSIHNTHTSLDNLYQSFLPKIRNGSVQGFQCCPHNTGNIPS